MNTEQLPGHQEQPGEIVCHNCGRFVGPLNKCPHCGAKIHKRLSVRFFRRASLLLGVMGVFFLWLMVTHRDIPVVEIGVIQRTMNFAFVRVTGKVVSDARVQREGDRVDSLSFVVDDGTGELDVKAYRAKARELVDLDLVPGAGDEVEVAGSLNVAVDRMAMWLASPDQITLKRKPAKATTLGAVDESLVGSKVILRGVVTTVTTPKMGTRAPWGMVFTDGTGSGRLSIWQGVYDGLADKVEIGSGTCFEAVVKVVLYHGAIQYELNQPADFTPVDAKPLDYLAASHGSDTVVRLADVTPEMKGQLVSVQGPVGWVFSPPEKGRGSRSDHMVMLGEGEKELPVFFNGEVAASVDPNLLATGTELRIQGLVSSNEKGSLLRVYHASQIISAP